MRHQVKHRATMKKEAETYAANLGVFFTKVLPKFVQKTQEDPLFFPGLLVEVIRGGVLSLRHYLENPTDESVSWTNPWTELHYPISWNWEKNGVAFLAPENFPRETLNPILEAIQKGEDPFKTVPEALTSLLASMLTESMTFLTLSTLTHHAGLYFKKGSKEGRAFVMEGEAKEKLDALTTDEEREDFWAATMEPFSIGGLEVLDEDGNGGEDGRPFILTPLEHEEPEPGETLPPWVEAVEEKAKNLPKLFFKGEASGVPFKGSVVIMFHPLVVDENTRKAYFPIVVGLVLAPVGEDVETAVVDPSTWTDEEREELWKTLLEDVPKKLLEGLQEEETTGPEAQEAAATISSSATVQATGAVQVASALVHVGAPAPERRYLLDAPTRIDRGAILLQANTGGLKLPRKWKDVPRWEDLAHDEVERLLEQYGDEAFRDLRAETQDQNAHGKLLERRTTARGETIVTLTSEAEDDLLSSVGHRGFRRVLQDQDGARREYLVKRFPVRGGAGYMEARLSWYGRTWPLVDEGREEQRNRLEEARLNPSLPFDDLEAETQDSVNRQLRLMESIRDAREIMGAILYAFGGAQGENPLKVPAWNLRTLLECENDPGGFRRVRGCLRALQEVRFHLKASGIPGVSREAWGPFLGAVTYIPRGPGEHTDGDFLISISEPFVGCLHVFQTTAYRIREPYKVLTLDWGKKLSKEERKSLDYLKGFSALAPYYDRAKGFTSHQTNLRRWIEDNLTRRKDATRRGSSHVRVAPTAPDADEPRLYGRETCPILPQDRVFHGALGHFGQGERGRTLFGTPTKATKTSGGHKAGLLVEMGYALPPGAAGAKRAEIVRKALRDMRAVVEEAFRGVVAGRHGDVWVSLEEAGKLPVDTILKEVVWYLFLAQDWRKEIPHTVEAYHAGRHARGETPYLVGVTVDRAVVDKAEAQRGLPAEAVGLEGEPLRVRLYIARKERKLSQADVGALFGVSQKTVDYWEKGLELAEGGKQKGKPKGKPIPPDVVPLILRWVADGTPPTAEELTILAARRSKKPGTRKVS